MIQATTLDQFIKEQSLKKVDLIKIDVEGFTDFVLKDSSITRKICNSFIIEFSIGDVKNRLTCDDLEVSSHFNQLISIFKNKKKFFISRNNGLISFHTVEELYTLLLLDGFKAGVGDVLFCENPPAEWVPYLIYTAKKIRWISEKNLKSETKRNLQNERLKERIHKWKTKCELQKDKLKNLQDKLKNSQKSFKLATRPLYQKIIEKFSNRT